MVADERLDLAEALLAKARSTSFEAERQSFVVGAAHQLSAFLGSDTPAGRRLGDRSSGACRATIGRGPLAPLPAPAGGEEAGTAGRVTDTATTDGEAGASGSAMVVDLAAAERAYRSHGPRATPGVLVDLAI